VKTFPRAPQETRRLGGTQHDAGVPTGARESISYKGLATVDALVESQRNPHTPQGRKAQAMRQPRHCEEI
jgi:hypothetical protein